MASPKLMLLVVVSGLVATAHLPLDQRQPPFPRFCKSKRHPSWIRERRERRCQGISSRESSTESSARRRQKCTGRSTRDQKLTIPFITITFTVTVTTPAITI